MSNILSIRHNQDVQLITLCMVRLGNLIKPVIVKKWVIMKYL